LSSITPLPIAAGELERRAAPVERLRRNNVEVAQYAESHLPGGSVICGTHHVVMTAGHKAVFAAYFKHFVEGAAGFSSEGSGLLRLSLYARYLHKLPYDIHHFLTVRIYEF